MEAGDYIQGSVQRYLCNNGLNFDYIIRGELMGKKGVYKFTYKTTHYSNLLKQNYFYKKFFELYENENRYSLDRLGEFISESFT